MMKKIEEGIGLSLARLEAHKEYKVAKGLVVIQVDRVKVHSQEVEKPLLVIEPLMKAGVQKQTLIDTLKLLKASICTEGWVIKGIYRV